MSRKTKDNVSSMATQTAARLAAWPVYLQEELQEIPEVVAAFASLEGYTVRLRIFVHNYGDEVIDKILDVEDRFAEVYRQTFLFDVLASPASGSLADVVPGAKQIYFNS